MTVEMVWGRTAHSKRIHLIINGKRQCIIGNGNPRPIIDYFPEWNPDDPLTCKNCRERYFWLMKGAKSVEQIKQIKTH